MLGLIVFIAFIVLTVFMYARPKKPRRSHYFQGNEIQKPKKRHGKDPVTLLFVFLLAAFLIFVAVYVVN